MFIIQGNSSKEAPASQPASFKTTTSKSINQHYIWGSLNIPDIQNIAYIRSRYAARHLSFPAHCVPTYRSGKTWMPSAAAYVADKPSAADGLQRIPVLYLGLKSSHCCLELSAVTVR